MLNSGSLAGAITFALFLLYYYALGLNPLGGIKYFSLVVPIYFMYQSVKKYKQTECEGYLTYGQGFFAALLFSFVYASLSGMLVYLYGLIVDGSFVSFFITDNLQTLGQAKKEMIAILGEDTYRKMLDEFQNIDLGDLALSDFQSKLFGGFFIALIIAAILRQNPPVFESTEHEQ